MDINRTRSRPSEPPKALDGFFSKPAGVGHHPALSQTPGRGMSSDRRAAGNGLSGNRRVDDFRRPNGFYAAPRRSAGLGSGLSQGAVSGSPGIGQGNVRRSSDSAIASQFNQYGQPVEGHESRHDRRSRRAAKRHARHGRTKAKGGKLRTFGRWMFRGTAICLILVLVAGGFLFGKGYFKLKKVFNGTSSAAALQTDVDPIKLKGEGDGRVNILLLGIGGADHSGGDLTDTLMIASIDPVNNQAILFSVPRDLWVKMPNNYISNYQKINAAYESGKYKYIGKQDMTNSNQKAIQAGFDAVNSTVERVMGVPIHYNMLVNFQAFRQAVDTVGGVTINAPEQLYDPTMAWENGWSPVLAKVGINNFDGKHALNYVRSRETSSDFARSQRQRAVLLALKDKVISAGTLANPVKISNLLSAFGDNVKSDISLNDMNRLVQIGKNIPGAQVQSVGLADGPNNFITTGNVNGLSVVQPRAGLEDYSKIQAFVRSKLKDGYITQENANVTVLNGTVTPGLASEKAEELKSYGYNIGTVDNAPTDDFAKTVIVDLSHGSKKYTLNYLKNRYHVQTVATQMPPNIVPGAANIVIILGQDATLATQN